ncbi:unnamed protein product [Arctogadus glacialis]
MQIFIFNAKYIKMSFIIMFEDRNLEQCNDEKSWNSVTMKNIHGEITITFVMVMEMRCLLYFLGSGFRVINSGG